MESGQLDVSQQYGNSDLQLPSSLPKLNGSWFMLVFPIELDARIKTKTGGSIFLPDSASDANNALLTAGIVVKQGALCYKHSKYKDPVSGEFLPWCNVGDYVVYSRTSFGNTVIHGNKKFYLIPDDGILYTVGSPKEIDSKFSYDEEQFVNLKKEVLALPKDEQLTL